MGTLDDFDLQNIEANERIRRGIEREKMMTQIDRIDHNVAVIAGSLCAAFSLGAALLIAHELEDNGYRIAAMIALVVVFFGLNRLLRRGVK